MLGNSWLCDKGVKVAAQPMTREQIRREIKSFKVARAFGAIGAVLALIGVIIAGAKGMDGAWSVFALVLLVFVVIFGYAGGRISRLRRQAGDLHRRGF